MAPGKKKIPECSVCGHRSGAPGHNQACTLPKSGLDGRRKTAGEAAAQEHGSGLKPRDFTLPEGAEVGAATADGNKCPIHSIVQLAPPSLSFQESAAYFAQISRVLLQNFSCPQKNLPTAF